MRGKERDPDICINCPLDHPRTCGEKSPYQTKRIAAKGSPPHMRGKERGSTSRLRRKGITPAHAGKSAMWQDVPNNEMDHPRTCGEKKNRLERGGEKAGSPPHMRGKGILGVLNPTSKRITPAHAGKRRRSAERPPPHADHPRTCGEKPFGYQLRSRFRGSPPHMRGKEPLTDEEMQTTRITPAHAGKRLKRSRSTVPHAAIVPLFPSVCNKPAGSDGSPAGHDAPPFLPIENAAPASPAYNLRSL